MWEYLYARKGIVPSKQESEMKIENERFDVVYVTNEQHDNEAVQSGSGGLGVVADSYMEEIECNHERHGLTALGVSFYCRYGYQRQVIRHEDGVGYMDVTYEQDTTPHTKDTGIRLILTLAGRPCHIAVRVPCDRERHHTAMALLDTDIDENPEDFRMITRVLYGEGHATAFFSAEHQPWHDIIWLRVLQAAVLGLGTYELLRVLNVRYRVIHLNESHAVFFLIHQFGLHVRSGLTREQALDLVRRNAFFTNHTMLESGNKRYPSATVMQVAGHYPGFDHETLLWINPSDQYSLGMTEAALYLAGPGHTNGVSVQHAEIANMRWPGYEIIPITNGLSAAYQHPEFRRLDRPNQIPDLKRHFKAEAHRALSQRASEAGCVIRVDIAKILKAVLVVWARRCQEYKRSGLLFHGEEFEIARKLLEWGWISIAWGGYVHPDDKGMHQEWNRYLQRIRALPNVMPILNYRLDLMRPLLKAAANIWVNTPYFGHEACGTSWMSAMLNCALTVSINDGGVREAQHVVTFGSGEQGNWHAQYVADARSLWETLIPQVVLLLRNDPATLAFLFDAMHEAEEKFSATRMVDEYRKLLYKI